MRPGLTERDLRRELSGYLDRFPRLDETELFVLWFLRAFVADTDEAAAGALTGVGGDKNLDAVLVDDARKHVFIVQGKLRKGLLAKLETRNDVMGFAEIAGWLTGSPAEYRSFSQDLPADIQGRTDAARERIMRRGYRLHLYYVTTGKASEKLIKEAERLARRATTEPMFRFFDGRRLMLLLSDYLDGVAPPVPALELEVESGGRAGADGIMRRFDPSSGIESFVFSIGGSVARDLYAHAGLRLFARNVRGFLGKTAINEGMEDTLAKEPEYFWYYNNGITIVCDDAELALRNNRYVMRLSNPQVINGQQTTRTLASGVGKKTGASVLVRVIRVERGSDDEADRFDSLVTRIVAATNYQNAIKASDLMANDRRQIQIERGMRPLGFWYLRKRMTKGEARKVAAARHYTFVKRDQLAQAVGACELDPAIVRAGKEGLFEERWYPKVFPNADPFFYLPRYCLMDIARRSARGYPQRAYATWVAINFLWSRLEPGLPSRAAREGFVDDWLEKGDAYWTLRSAGATVLRATLQFYRVSKGTGEKAVDISTFFQRTGLHTAFARFWSGSRNSHRKRFDASMKRFTKAVQARMKG